jgi:glutamate 5-kinase
VGDFVDGDVVEIQSEQGVCVARGRVRSAADTLRAGLGHERGVVVHRDDLVMEEG